MFLPFVVSRICIPNPLLRSVWGKTVPAILWEDFSFCSSQCHHFRLFPLCCQHGVLCKWKWKDAQIIACKAAWLTVVLGLLMHVRHCEYPDSSPLGLVHGSAHGSLASSRSSELGREQEEPRLLKDPQCAELQRWLCTLLRSSAPQSPLSTHCSPPQNPCRFHVSEQCSPCQKPQLPAASPINREMPGEVNRI